jgi:hypothetical protein
MVNKHGLCTVRTSQREPTSPRCTPSRSTQLGTAFPRSTVNKLCYAVAPLCYLRKVGAKVE